MKATALLMYVSMTIAVASGMGVAILSATMRSNLLTQHGVSITAALQ